MPYASDLKKARVFPEDGDGDFRKIVFIQKLKMESFVSNMIDV